MPTPRRHTRTKSDWKEIEDFLQDKYIVSKRFCRFTYKRKKKD